MDVLIPLNSGRDTDATSDAQHATQTVLIPLNSGRDTDAATQYGRWCKFVLIPLNSGRDTDEDRRGLCHPLGS